MTRLGGFADRPADGNAAFASVYLNFIHTLSQMSAGDSVTLAQMGAELSTQQAAELLGVSRPYFIKLLEQGKMPFRKVGNQRRVRYFDVIQYKNDYCLAANAALDEMTEEAQRLGLYD